MKANKNKICYIVPAFNEENNISKTIFSLKKYAQVIVIDDFSSDKTALISKNSGAEVIRHIKNKGYSEAINTGLNEAKKKGFLYAITYDADAQHYTSDTLKFFSYLKKGYYIVHGRRPSKQRLMEKIFSLYTKKIYKINDPLCGLKGYNLKKLKKKDFFLIDNLIGTRLLLNAKKKKMKIKELKISIKEREDISKFGGVINGNIKIFIAFLKLISIDLIQTLNVIK